MALNAFYDSIWCIKGYLKWLKISISWSFKLRSFSKELSDGNKGAFVAHEMRMKSGAFETFWSSFKG